MTKGYRKIPGNKCEGGIDFNPDIVKCEHNNTFEIVFLLIILFALYLAMQPSIEEAM